MSGEGPVKKGGSNQSHMRVAGRRRTKPHSDRRTRGRRPRSSFATGLTSRPSPSMATSTISPSRSVDTPAGVPVKMTSPGRRVMALEVYAINSAIEKTICEVRPCCTRPPLTTHETSKSEGSIAVSIHGPKGAKVSNPLARPHCPSRRCRSRAVTSLAQVKPSTTSSARSTGT